MAEQLNRLPKNSDVRTLKAHMTLYYGKHKGKTVEHMITENPAWIIWTEINNSGIQFDPEVIKRAQAALGGDSSVNFALDEKELTEHAEVLHKLSMGLDSYSNNGIREVHGIDNDTNVHRTLDYFRRLTVYLKSKLETPAVATNNPF